MLSLFKKLLLMLFFAFPLFYSHTSIAKEKHWGKLVHCVSPSNLKKGKVCVLKTSKARARKGSSVLVYNRTYKWIGTGTVYARRGNYTVVIFANSKTPILKNYFFRIDPRNDNFDWESSFSQRSLQKTYDI
ncbi:MAG: hypothetical protein HRU09_17545 [Oligoflexales bacterium]|nr:hypothetical protein [Oligoflexales bacterium]